MNHETAKVRMPSVLMNEKDILVVQKFMSDTILFISYLGEIKISSNHELDIFYTINYHSFQYLKIISRFI